MEQRLNATYLRAGLIERTAGLAICAVGIGAGMLLVAWGISFLWRYTPPEIKVRVANPELHLAPVPPLKVVQDKPFVVTQSAPFKLDSANVSVGMQPQQIDNAVIKEDKTAAGDVIKREVTVFSNVKHGPGTVVTGWNFKDGSGGVPVYQFCYYSTVPNLDHSTTRVDIAANRVPWPIDAALVPDLNMALTKCQWWNQ